MTARIIPFPYVGDVKPGDVVVFTVARLPDFPFVATVLRKNRLTFSVRLAGDEGVRRVAFHEIEQMVRVPDEETGKAVAARFARARERFRVEVSEWSLRRERALREFSERWDRENPYPKPPTLLSTLQYAQD